MAASALGNINDVRSVLPLIEALTDDGRLYPRQIESVDRTPVGEIARWSLEKIGKHNSEMLVRALEHENERIRVGAASILADEGNPLAVEPLIACLSGKVYRVRSLAIKSLGIIRDSRAVEPLITLLSGDVYTLYDTILALDLIGDTRAIKPLADLFKYAQNDNLRKQIQLRDKRAEKIFEDLWRRMMIQEALKDALRHFGYDPDTL